MPAKSLLPSLDTALLYSSVEPKARREAAKHAKLPSGSIPVLCAVVVRANLGRQVQTKHLISAGIANVSLIRSYVRQLIAAKMFTLERRRGCRYLTPTSNAKSVAYHYYRLIRGGGQALQRMD